MYAACSESRSQDEEADVASSLQQSMIPCELCLELFDEHVITEHQVSLTVNVEFLCILFISVPADCH